MAPDHLGLCATRAESEQLGAPRRPVRAGRNSNQPPRSTRRPTRGSRRCYVLARPSDVAAVAIDETVILLTLSLHHY